MNKLIKLVLVNLLGLFDYNGVLKEVEAGVKGKSETRLIVVAIASIIYGYLVYAREITRLQCTASSPGGQITRCSTMLCHVSV